MNSTLVCIYQVVGYKDAIGVWSVCKKMIALSRVFISFKAFHLTLVTLFKKDHQNGEH